MAGFVTGDIHGWLDIGKLTPDRWPKGKQLKHSDLLVICGDFGLLWSDPPTIEERFFLDWLDGCPWTTLFIDGNHENFDLLDRLPTCTWRGGKVGRIPGTKHILHLMRGQVYEMGADGRWFCMGGAPSHDIEGRMEGVSWWPRELPNEQEYAEARANLDRVGWSVDYVFSHDVPRKLRRFAMARHYDVSREKDDVLSAFLQEVDDRLDRRRLKVWYAGHYHDDIMLRDSHHAELYNQVVRLGEMPDGRIHRHLPYCKESWQGVEGLGRHYREWLLSRRIEGCTITWEDNENINLATSTMFGKISFEQSYLPNAYGRDEDPDDLPEVVTMRIVRKHDGAPIFQLRFELTEILRAKELFLEMAEELGRTDNTGATRVLLCCSLGITSAIFERKLTELAESLSLRYRFSAMTLDEAIASHRDFDVIMVAPQLGYRRRDAQKAYPYATVIEVRNEVIACRDARKTLDLLLDALGAGVEQLPPGTSARVRRPIDSTKDVMVISVERRTDMSMIGYRIFAGGRVAHDGVVYKCHVDMRDIEDVLATVRVDGWDVRHLDAVGIAMPGVINAQSISLPSSDVRDYDFGRRLEKLYGTEVFMDNEANAAAMGCYISQSDYDSVIFHIQSTGVLACSEGVVDDGHLVKGRRNFAGELAPVSKLVRYSGNPEDLVWTYEGMTEIVAGYLAASICSVSPDAVYVAAPLVRDMVALRRQLAQVLPETYIPELYVVDDVRELMYLGELALCVDKLIHRRPHRKW